MARPSRHREDRPHTRNRSQDHDRDLNYLLSMVLSAERFNEVTHALWGGEPAPLEALDVVMNEEQDRTRFGNGPNNLAVM